MAAKATAGGHPGVAIAAAGGHSGMDFITGLQASLVTLLSPFFVLLDQRNVFSYVGALFFMFLFVCAIRIRRSRKDMRLGALVRLLFRKSVWLHPSAMLDYKVYLVNMPLLAFVLGIFIAGTGFWAGLTGSALGAIFGPPPPSSGEANWIIAGSITLVLLLAFDFGYWLSHTLAHKIPYLWAFHRVHHSAEVLTIATEYRQHPVDLVAHPSIIGLTTGVAYATTTQLFGTEMQALGHYGFNIIILTHLFTFHHLRHTHINMAFTGLAGKILHSPAHHIVHHSSDPQHYDRNMGYILSIWDWMAGSLHVPVRGERLTLGIGAEGAAHDTVSKIFLKPFVDFWTLLTLRLHPGLRQRSRS